MRNIEKWPHNANVVTVYLSDEALEVLDKLCEQSGLSRGKCLTAFVKTVGPRVEYGEVVTKGFFVR